MSQYRYLVLGTGVGRAIAWWLLQQKDTKKVTLGDIDYRRAEAAVAGICPDYAKTERCMPTGFNARDNHARRFEACDVVISAIPAQYNENLAHAALGAGTHFCDLGGVLEVSQRMQDQLDGPAKDHSVSIIRDCGLMPGLGNVMARHLEYGVGGAESITIYVGGLPQKLQPPHNYQRTFSLEGLLHILDPSPIIRKGVVKHVPPCAEYELLDIPALEQFGTPFGGTVEAFITAGAGTAPLDFHARGIKDFCEKTIRWPGFLRYIETIPREQLLERFTNELPVTDAEHPDLVWMRVVARRSDRYEESWELLDTYDHTLDMSAMVRTTGFSAAAMAYLAAQGLTKKGVNPPEESLTHDGIMTYLGMLSEHLDIRHSHY